MASSRPKNTPRPTKKVLVALRRLVRPAAAPAKKRPARISAAAAPVPAPFTPQRAREIALALRGAEDRPLRLSGAALPVRPHVVADPSPHVVEVRLTGASAGVPAEVRSGVSHRLESWAAAALAAPRRHDEELRLNPHRADARRPDALAARAQAHVAIPAALVRTVSEAAEAGVERLTRPFASVLAVVSPDREQPILSAGGDLPDGALQAFDAVDPVQDEPPVALRAPSGGRPWTAGLQPLGGAWSWRRSLAAVVLIGLVALGPIHALGAYASVRRMASDIRLRAVSALDAVRSAGSAAGARDLPAASSALAAASQAFGDVRGSLGPVGGALLALAERLPGKSPARTAAALFTAGDTLTRAGERITGALGDLSADAPPTAVLRALKESVAALEPDVAAAATALAAVDLADVPAEHRAEVAALAGSADAIRRGFADFPPLAAAVEALLGADRPRRYLLLFQNNHELRATGGFIGSFAEIEVEHGRITDVRLPPGGSYDIQGDVRAWLNPPDPLRLVTGRWRFHDANWFADFPTSAEKLAWFYEKSGGPTVDGVIAVNATVLSELLAVTGPVEMPAYGVTLTSENVLDEIQRAVELAPADPAKPKQILSDLFPLLLARLQSPSPQLSLALADLAGRALRARQIQLSVGDPEVAAAFARFGWDGALRETDGDYLAVVATNVGGEKTDAVIRDDVMHEVAIGSDGRVTDTVTVTRTHRGIPGTPLTGVGNFTYLRVYVPAGSTLLSADGQFEPPEEALFIPRDPAFGEDPEVRAALGGAIRDRQTGTAVFEESGKTVFANWMRLLPGESKTVRFSYELPFRVEIPRAEPGLAAALTGAKARGSYGLFLQKQSGAEERYVTVRIRAPQGMRVLHALPAEVAATGDDARLDVWRQAVDRFVGVVFGR